MEPFDENDLKDMWESELDETQSLKTLEESYVHDWFEENKFKDCKVILNDKLMSDALLNGTIPIKSEHSYSLNSEGEFLQQSPRISRKREVERKLEGPLKAVGPRAALQHPIYATDIKKELSSAIISKLMKTSPCGNQDSDGDSSQTSGETIDFPSKGPFEMANRSGVTSFDMNLGQNQTHNTFNRLAKLVKTYNLHAFENESDGYTDDNSNLLPAAEVQKHKRQLMLRKLFAANETRDAMFENDWSVSTASEDYEESVSSEFSSDVEIEDSGTKVESITVIPSFTVTAESELQGMRIDETTKNSTNLSSAIMIETSLKSLDQKVRTKNPLKTVNKTSEAIVSDKVGQNRISESLRTKSLPNVSNTGQRKGQEMFDTKLSTMILTCGGHNKHDATQSIYSNVMPATISTKLPSSSSNSSIRQPINTPLISSQPKGSTGILMLTEEEKRTLIAEGYPVPQQLPLSKTEEKSLKKIRRKIKNKISAQESRRKKKEYMDQLERRVEILLNENNEYKKRIEVLENANNSLLDELRKQQH